jgi:hypothetical protein
MAPLERVLKALSNHRRSGKGYTARCPAHDDRQASLSVSEGEDGKVLLNCHAGCSVEKIVATMRLTMQDLFPRAAQDTAPGAKKDCCDTKAGLTVYAKAADAIADLERRHGPKSAWWRYDDATVTPSRL